MSGRRRRNWFKAVSFTRDEYRGADKSLTRPGRKQTRKHVRDARDFNNIETRAVIKFFFLQGKTPKEIHAILTETLACFLPGRAKDLSAPLYICINPTNALIPGTKKAKCTQSCKQPQPFVQCAFCVSGIKTLV